MCGKRVGILRMWWVLSFFPRSQRAIRLLVDCAARPPHVFATALLAHLPLEAAAQDAQTLIPALKTFCWSRLLVS